MIIVPIQSVQAQPLPEAVGDAKAAAKAINDAGGVKGRPIEIEQCDEKGVPTAATACARKAVADKVDAVFLTSNFGASALPGQAGRQEQPRGGHLRHRQRPAEGHRDEGHLAKGRNRLQGLHRVPAHHHPLGPGCAEAQSMGADGPKGYEQVSNSTVYPLSVGDGKVIADGDPVNVFHQAGLQ